MTRQSGSSSRFLAPLVGLVFVLVVASSTRFLAPFEFDPDESNNLVKALCLRHGFSLGKDIWTDQPPVFSYLLSALFRVTGPSVAAARVLSLLFSGALVASLFALIERYSGRMGAALACLFLVSSAGYVPLSVSVMIGLPALALALLSLCLLEVARDRAFPNEGEADPRAHFRSALPWTLAAAAALGLSLGTKLFTAFLVPLFTLVLTAPALRKRQRRFGSLAPGAVFGVAVVLVTLLCLFPILRHGNLSGLVEAHANSREMKNGDFDGAGTVQAFFREDWWLFGSALLALPVLVARRRFAALSLVTWLAGATLALLDHYPVWPHHRLLLTVPAAGLAGFSIGEVCEILFERFVATERRTKARALTGVGLGLALSAVVLLLVPQRLRDFREPKTWANDAEDWKIAKEVAKYAPGARFMMASRPMFAFRRDVPVPPNLAVTSWKRFRTRLLSAKAVVRDLEKYDPELVLLSSRWPRDVQRRVKDAMKTTHRRVKSWPYQHTELWVRSDLVSPKRGRGPSEANEATPALPEPPPQAEPPRTEPPQTEPTADEE